MKQAFNNSIEQYYSDSLVEPVATDAKSDFMLHYIRVIHGVVLGASFMALYPIGATLIHHGNFKNAFTYHWACQISLTAACLLTVVMGLMFSGNGVKVSQDFFVETNSSTVMADDNQLVSQLL